MYIDQDGELFLFILGGALIGSYVGASIKGKSFNPAKWEGNWWQGALWGGGIGAIGGALVGSVWAAGGSISFGVQAFGLEPVTLISFSKATAATGGVVTASIGGTTAATSIASYTFGKSKESEKEKILKGFETSSTAVSGITFAGDQVLKQSTYAFREMQKTSNVLDLGLEYSNELGKIGRWGNATRWAGATGGLLGIGTSGYQLTNANTFEEKVEHGFDTAIGGFGLIGGPLGAGVSLYWGTAGKPLHNTWRDRVLTPQLEGGVVPYRIMGFK